MHRVVHTQQVVPLTQLLALMNANAVTVRRKHF